MEEKKFKAGNFGHATGKGFYIIDELGKSISYDKNKKEYKRIYAKYHVNTDSEYVSGQEISIYPKL